MQLSRTKFPKSFILSTKKWIKCFPGKNPVYSREKSGDITLCYRESEQCLKHEQNPEVPPGYLYLPVQIGLNLKQKYPDTLSPIKCVLSMETGKYTGQYKNERFHGYGSCIWTHNDRYKGGWREGKFHGKGKLEFESGETYEGEFFYGKRHGQGKQTLQHSVYFEGEWCDGIPHGKGSLRNHRKKLLIGVWHKGLIQSEADCNGSSNRTGRFSRCRSQHPNSGGSGGSFCGNCCSAGRAGLLGSTGPAPCLCLPVQAQGAAKV